MIVSCRISSLALLLAVVLPVAARQTASTAYQTAIPHMLFQRTQPVLPVCRSAGASSTLTTARRNVAASANCARVHSRLWLAQLAASQHDTQKKNSGGGRVKAPCILLNEDIVAAAAQSRDGTLCALVEDRWLEFNAVNAATAYGKLLLLTTSRDTATARQSALGILETCLLNTHVSSFKARQCANTLHALAKSRRRAPDGAILMSVEESDLVDALEERALTVANKFKSMEIAIVLWALARLGRRPFAPTQAHIHDQTPALGEAAAIEEGIDVFAAEKEKQYSAAEQEKERDGIGRADELECRTTALVAALSVRACVERDSFNPQDISNTLWAIATMGFSVDSTKRAHVPTKRLLRALTARALTPHVMQRFKSQPISNTLWALASMRRTPEKRLVAALTARAQEEMNSFNPEDISLIFWAFATWGIEADAQLVSALMARARDVAGDFRSLAISNTLWAVATMRLTPDRQFVAALTARTLQVQGDFKEDELSRTLWAFQELGFKKKKVDTSAQIDEKSAQSDENSGQ